MIPSCKEHAHVWGVIDTFGTKACINCGIYAEKKMNNPESLTNERKSTHGDWGFQAATAQQLKQHLHLHKGWNGSHLSVGQMEALDMIAVKISRILCGNPNEPDHWDDIAGYAYLGKGGHKS